MAGFRLAVGLVARIIFWIGAGLIVYEAGTTLWHHGEKALAVASALFFPVTILVWPWKHEAFNHPLWIVLAILFVSYPISTFVGGLPTIDRPGDF
jgi:hypothetical protein